MSRSSLEEARRVAEIFHIDRQYARVPQKRLAANNSGNNDSIKRFK